jgi:hypothetical protein
MAFGAPGMKLLYLKHNVSFRRLGAGFEAHALLKWDGEHSFEFHPFTA